MLTPNTYLQKRFRIIRPLGKGGMGHVYEAMDDALDCIVAIKETFANNDEQRRAFKREARLLANLRHPNLPRVTHHFFEGNGQFLVMDYIEGDTLDSLLDRRRCPFSYSEVLPWAEKLLDALEYLHSFSEPIVHRDIKPSNAKLTERGEMFLLDFGLAKGVAGRMTNRESGHLSVHGFTAAYAPLEQMSRSGTNAQSDLYSLGATLYHLLTGEVPVTAADRFVQMEQDLPDPLLPAHQLNPDMHIQQSIVLSQAMAISRKNRFASAIQMRLALREAAAAIPSNIVSTATLGLAQLDRRPLEPTLPYSIETPAANLETTPIPSEVVPTPTLGLAHLNTTPLEPTLSDSIEAPALNLETTPIPSEIVPTPTLGSTHLNTTPLEPTLSDSIEAPALNLETAPIPSEVVPTPTLGLAKLDTTTVEPILPHPSNAPALNLEPTPLTEGDPKFLIATHSALGIEEVLEQAQHPLSKTRGAPTSWPSHMVVEDESGNPLSSSSLGDNQWSIERIDNSIPRFSLRTATFFQLPVWTSFASKRRIVIAIGMIAFVALLALLYSNGYLSGSPQGEVTTQENQELFQLTADALTHVNEGTALKQQNRKLEAQREYVQAESLYRRAVLLSPSNPKLHVSLASVCILREEWTEAIKEYREAVRLAPTNTEYQSTLKQLEAMKK